MFTGLVWVVGRGVLEGCMNVDRLVARVFLGILSSLLLHDC